MTDDELRNLFDDAVADVVPTDRLGEIRRRTAQPPTRSRRWGLVLAAGTATAAVVGAVALVGQLGSPGENGDPAGSGDRRAAVAAYFVAETPEGDRLFREFQTVPAGDVASRTLDAVRLLESDAGAKDPDYRTEWPDGSFQEVAITDDAITLTVSTTTNAIGLQQAVYTAQAAVGETLPVTFTSSDRVINEAVARDDALLTPVNITDPAEGHSVNDLLTLRGVWRGGRDNFDNTVPWSLRSADNAVVRSGQAPASGGTWEQTIDIADLAPGTYVLTVRIANNNGRATDTRTITVR